jgi:hypothetical protein
MSGLQATRSEPGVCRARWEIARQRREEDEWSIRHLVSDAADRTPPDELIAVLRTLDDVPTPSMAREIPAVD